MDPYANQNGPTVTDPYANQNGTGSGVPLGPDATPSRAMFAGLARPLTPGVPTAIVGAGAVPPLGAAQRTALVMDGQIVDGGCFQLPASSALLPREAFDAVVDRLNSTLKGAVPRGCRCGTWLLLVACLTFGGIMKFVAACRDGITESATGIPRLVVAFLFFSCACCIF